MEVEITNKISEPETERLDYSIAHPIKAMYGYTLFPSCHPLSCGRRIWRDTEWPQVSV